MTQEPVTCPVAAMTQLLGSRWTMQIIHHLRKRRRFCELRAAVGDVNPTTFTRRLQTLEEQGIIVRYEDPNNRRHVEYELTAMGRELLPLLDDLAQWAQVWVLQSPSS